MHVLTIFDLLSNASNVMTERVLLVEVEQLKNATELIFASDDFIHILVVLLPDAQSEMFQIRHIFLSFGVQN